MITQQKLTFISRKLGHFYGDKSRAMSQPTATRFVQINMISVVLLRLNLVTMCEEHHLNLDLLSCYSIALSPGTLHAILTVGDFGAFYREI